MTLDLEGIARALGGAKRTSNGFDARCPCHDDKTASLSLTVGNNGKLVVHCHVGCAWEALFAELKARSLWPERVQQTTAKRRQVATYDYVDEAGALVFQVVRYEPKDFRQRRRPRDGDDPAKIHDGWSWGMRGTRIVPYRLPEVLAAIGAKLPVAVVEGEKDADRLAKVGFAATCNAMGASKSNEKCKWRREHSAFLKGADVVIVPDNDEAGRAHAAAVAASLSGIARRVRILELPGLPPKGDVSDWLDAGGTAEQLWALAENTPTWAPSIETPRAAPGKARRTATHPIEDFVAYLPEGKVIHRPTRALWVPKSVDRVAAPPAPGSAYDWLTAHNAVDQMTWAPGEAEIVEGRLFDEGGWVTKAGARVFNFYRPPSEIRGDPGQAGRWEEHVRFLYPNDADHICDWLAQRVQQPAVKINHALVLGGVQRIGKDSILVPVRAAIGEWNFKEIAAHRLLDRFNGWLKSVLLRVNEAHDMGELNRFQFYERIKGYTAAPPEVLSIDEKNVKAYAVPNVTGLVLTTNHKTDGMYLPADDHRHYVAWSDRTLDDFEDGYFASLHRWFAAGGAGHVAAWLAARDIAEFDPKAPPPQTDAWWEIVLAGQSPEKTDLADIIASLGNPDALTIGDIAARASSENSPVAAWLTDAKTRRQVPHRMEEAGYIAARNPFEREKGRWKVRGRNETVYAKKTLSMAERIAAAKRLAGLI